MFAFAGRDDDRIDLGVRDDGVIVGGMQRSADFLRQRGGLRRILVGYRNEAHRGMPGRELRAQSADAA